MRIIRHHEPWNLLTQWQKDLDRLSRGGSLPDNDEETNVATSAWTPAVDIREEETRFVIYADIPGVDPKDIEITMEQGVLTLRGERPLEEENERKLYKRVERIRGTFYRRLVCQTRLMRKKSPPAANMAYWKCQFLNVRLRNRVR